MSRDDVRQIVLGIAGALLFALVIAVWGWVSEEGLVSKLGGVSQATLDEALAGIKKAPAEEPAVAKLLANAVVMTEQECKSFGPDWKRYEGMDGRFPLGAGQTTDSNKESRTFIVGQADGAYRHQLTVAEMPSHTHSFHGSRGEAAVDDWDNEQAHRDHGRETGATGGNQPHNNTPPYRVMNFCHVAPSAPS